MSVKQKTGLILKRLAALNFQLVNQAPQINILNLDRQKWQKCFPIKLRLSLRVQITISKANDERCVVNYSICNMNRIFFSANRKQANSYLRKILSSRMPKNSFFCSFSLFFWKKKYWSWPNSICFMNWFLTCI